MNFDATISKHMRALQRHRERYVRAWMAVTGATDPRECVLVEHDRGVLGKIIHVESRAQYDTRGAIEQALRVQLHTERVANQQLSKALARARVEVRDAKHRVADRTYEAALTGLLAGAHCGQATTAEARKSYIHAALALSVVSLDDVDERPLIQHEEQEIELPEEIATPKPDEDVLAHEARIAAWKAGSHG